MMFFFFIILTVFCREKKKTSLKISVFFFVCNLLQAKIFKKNLQNNHLKKVQQTVSQRRHLDQRVDSQVFVFVCI